MTQEGKTLPYGDAITPKNKPPHHWLHGDVILKVAVVEETNCSTCSHKDVCDHRKSSRCSNYNFGTSDKREACEGCIHRFTRKLWDDEGFPCFHCSSHSTASEPSPKGWKIIESVPDKNGFVFLGVKEDPNGPFVSRGKALDYIAREAQIRTDATAAAIEKQRRRVFEKLTTGKCVPDGDCTKCILCDNMGGCIAEEIYQTRQAITAEQEQRKQLIKAINDDCQCEIDCPLASSAKDLAKRIQYYIRRSQP